jgi:hypothetical protein
MFILVVLVLVGSASSLLAAPAQTYHGTLEGGTFYCGTDQVSGPIVTGTWNVSIDPETPAQVTLNVFYNGSHHLAFGYNALMQVSLVNGVYMFSGFGDAVTATLIRMQLRQHSPGTSNSASAATRRITPITPTTR